MERAISMRRFSSDRGFSVRWDELMGSRLDAYHILLI